MPTTTLHLPASLPRLSEQILPIQNLDDNNLSPLPNAVQGRDLFLSSLAAAPSLHQVPASSPPVRLPSLPRRRRLVLRLASNVVRLFVRVFRPSSRTKSASQSLSYGESLLSPHDLDDDGTAGQLGFGPKGRLRSASSPTNWRTFPAGHPRQRQPLPQRNPGCELYTPTLTFAVLH